MIIDKLMSPAYKASIVAGATGNTLLGDALDLSDIRNNGMLNRSGNPGFVITFTTAMAGAGSSVSFAILTDSAANMATPVVLATSEVVALAAGLVGKQLFIPLPETDAYEQFIAIRQITAGAAISGGAVSVEFTSDMPKWRAYPSPPYNV